MVKLETLKKGDIIHAIIQGKYRVYLKLDLEVCYPLCNIDTYHTPTEGIICKNDLDVIPKSNEKYVFTDKEDCIAVYNKLYTECIKNFINTDEFWNTLYESATSSKRIYKFSREFYKDTIEYYKSHNMNDNAIKTKEVVIKGDNNWDNLLTPEQIIEYFKAKGKTIYCYELSRKTNSLYSITGNSSYKHKKVVFSFNKYEDNTYNDDSIDLIYFHMLFHGDNALINREDKWLIGKVKQLNKPNIIKVVNIPADVNYKIYENNCSGGEYISECHRTWN